MTADEQELTRKFEILCRRTDKYLKNMTPQQRDRVKQVHLAQARGPKRNCDFLAQMTDMILLLRAAQFESHGSKAGWPTSSGGGGADDCAHGSGRMSSSGDQ